jgi:hypothetical protein
MIQKIQSMTGKTSFTYVTAVTCLADPAHRSLWNSNAQFADALHGNPVKLVTLQEMLSQVFDQLGTTVESSQFSRTLQLIKAAKIKIEIEPQAE